MKNICDSGYPPQKAGQSMSWISGTSDVDKYVLTAREALISPDMEPHLSGCDPRLEVKLENEEPNCKGRLNSVNCEMGSPFVNGFPLSTQSGTIQIKTEPEEPHIEHRLNQVESSAGPLTDGGQFIASSQTPERAVASRTHERDAAQRTEALPDTGSLLRQSMMLLGEESFPLRPHSDEQQSSLCAFDSPAVACQDCVEHKRLIRELQEQLEFLRGTVSETVKSAVSEAVTAATEALTHSMRDIVKDAVAQAMTSNIKKEAKSQEQVAEPLQNECTPLSPPPKRSDGDEMVTATPAPANDVGKAGKGWLSSTPFPGTKGSSPSTSGAGNWKIGEQLPDVPLAPLSKKTLTHLARRANNESHRFAQMIFQHHVPFPLYQQWAKNVNIDGSRGKKALPRNLMRDIMLQTEAKFRLTDQDRKKVKDTINALLRMPRGASWISGPDP
ncbi:uncharacterized protein LOC105945410 isoform X4 [Xenopus tropicalis]|uniref:Uncharacterized protein LOC105945410 isoform X4 n=1 Tax=Xenopus tropicalis TaxID=8364 RepID=A0A8J1JQH0_XENTR|nr:uncharacterized protein LOC105945410 isoform X4 [Xenopus tropicalis]